MARGINEVRLLGNLGAAPEMRMTQSGTAVLNIRLATSEAYKRGDEWHERTEWHRVIVWARRAEALAKILRKGDRIHVSGSLRTSSYETSGVKKFSTEIVARDVLLLGGTSRQSKDDDYQELPPDAITPTDDDDIPF